MMDNNEGRSYRSNVDQEENQQQQQRAETSAQHYYYTFFAVLPMTMQPVRNRCKSIKPMIAQDKPRELACHAKQEATKIIDGECKMVNAK